jgi:hypothetical protein
VPLFFFYVGLLSAGVMMFGQLNFRWKMLEKNPVAREELIKRSRILKYLDRWTEPPQKIIAISYSCLFLGGVAAVVVYLCAAHGPSLGDI